MEIWKAPGKVSAVDVRADPASLFCWRKREEHQKDEAGNHPTCSLGQRPGGTGKEEDGGGGVKKQSRTFVYAPGVRREPSMACATFRQSSSCLSSNTVFAKTNMEQLKSQTN